MKINSSNSLNDQKYQSVNGSVKDALRLGCCAIGFTIYPGSEYQYDMIEEFKEISFEAAQYGLPSVLWSYPRGDVSKEGETSLDIISYAAHIAAQLGAHIIKVKPPTENIENKDLKKSYDSSKTDLSLLSNRISHIKKCAFNHKRIVVFSGGNSKNTDDLLEEIKQINLGGGNGSIIGRNTFQRPKEDAINLLKKIIAIYKIRKYIEEAIDNFNKTKIYLISPNNIEFKTFRKDFLDVASSGLLNFFQLRVKNFDDESLVNLINFYFSYL